MRKSNAACTVLQMKDAVERELKLKFQNAR